MPVTKQVYHCGHKGHGAWCHRCADAQRLLRIAEKMEKPAEGRQRTRHIRLGHAATGYAKWGKAELLELAIHLDPGCRTREVKATA